MQEQQWYNEFAPLSMRFIFQWISENYGMSPHGMESFIEDFEDNTPEFKIWKTRMIKKRKAERAARLLKKGPRHSTRIGQVAKKSTSGTNNVIRIQKG